MSAAVRRSWSPPKPIEDLEEAMKRGEIATIKQAEEFLRERHAIEYGHPDGVGQLLAATQGEAQHGPSAPREGRRARAGGL